MNRLAVRIGVEKRCVSGTAAKPDVASAFRTTPSSSLALKLIGFSIRKGTPLSSRYWATSAIWSCLPRASTKSGRTSDTIAL